MCIIATENYPDREFRLFCRENEILTGCQYREGRTVEAKTKHGIPIAVREYAKRALNVVRWYPDDLFVMDIAEANGNIRTKQF